MHGASISRWTMSYFAVAIVCLAMALGLLASGFGLPFPDAAGPDTLVVVHLVTIGWLGLLFSGALLQFVPVLVASRLKLGRLALPALLCLVAGMIMLEQGFLELGGHSVGSWNAMVPGAVLVCAGFALLLASIGWTIASQRSFGASVALVVIASTASFATLGIGTTLAALLSGRVEIPQLALLMPAMIPYHASSGLLGWMTLCALGVGYKLYAMFMLSPESPRSESAVIATAAGSLALLYTSIALAVMGSAFAPTALVLSVAFAALAIVFFGYDLLAMFRARRRKVLELNSNAGLVAFLFLPVGLSAIVCSLFPGANDALGPAGFYLLALGWLTGLGLAQLYKIIPFLTWLETYGPVMGRVDVPRVQDLVSEASVAMWFAVFHLAVATGAVAIFGDLEWLFRLASVCQLVSVLALALEYFRARRLAYAPAHLRLPKGALKPHLFHSIGDTKE